MKFIKLICLGFGLAIGGGLLFALYTSEMARIIFFGLLLFILGASIVGFVLLINNRQWTQALGMWRPPSTTNRYQLPPHGYQQQPNYYNVPESLPQIEMGQEAIGNDEPVA